MVKKISGPPLPNLDHLLGPEGKSPVSFKMFRNVPASRNFFQHLCNETKILGQLGL
jgi:hypothetical protein